jgi:hypothetical protein
VNNPPTAAAGNDTTYCVSDPEIPLHGTASGYASVTWTTNGDGTFGNAGSLSTSYFPGTGDKTTLSVHLTLTATPQAPCTNAASSTRNILFDPCGVGVPGNPGNIFSFAIRPNPSSGIITISGSGIKNEDIRIRVIDLSGKTVLTENHLAMNNRPEIKMDLSSLAKGIYFVRIETGSGVKTEKLILQ